MLSNTEKKRHATAYVRGIVQREGGPTKITKTRLAELAASADVAVERQDGVDGDPLKSDYLRALGL